MTSQNINNPSQGIRQRLMIILFILVGGTLTVGLMLFALSSNISFFYTPGDVIYGKDGITPKVGQHMQVGGMILPNSIQRGSNPLEITFIMFDKKAQLTVHYTGSLPNLFAEGQSTIVKGVLAENATIEAHTILAKHDENYAPPEIQRAMQENHTPAPQTQELQTSPPTPQGNTP